jgi:DNA-binding Lrp family transcriptional regulator
MALQNSQLLQMDDFDRAILRVLQKNNATPQRAIGEIVSLSAPAVQRRIKRMEQDGIIVRNVAMVDPAAVGHPLTLFVEVELESEQLELIDKAKRAFAATPQVQQCYYVTGEIDFILVVVVPSMVEYEALTRRLFFENHNVKRFRTFVTMDRVKVGIEVPV